MIRSLCREDIPLVVPLLETAYGRRAPFAERLGLYLAIEPGGWLLWEEAGEAVGMVGVTLHGNAACVGLMAVRPENQRKGLGGLLFARALDLAAARGAGLVMLDASDAGAPLYSRARFVDRGLTLDCAYDGAGRPERGATEPSLEEVLAFDRLHFGADRETTLRTYARAYPGRLVSVNRAGRIAAYALAQDHVIGPVVADDDLAAREVLAAALSLPFDRAPRVLVPEDRLALVELLGFRPTRSLRHMRRGSPDIPYRVVCKASLAVG